MREREKWRKRKRKGEFDRMKGRKGRERGVCVCRESEGEKGKKENVRGSEGKTDKDRGTFTFGP